MAIEVRTPEKSDDGKRVNIPIVVDGHPFQATFVRLPDGTISGPAMHVWGLSERTDAAELERQFHEAARRVAIDQRALIETMLLAAAPGPFDALKENARAVAAKAREDAQPAIDNARKAVADVREKLGLPPKRPKP